MIDLIDHRILWTMVATTKPSRACWSGTSGNKKSGFLMKDAPLTCPKCGEVKDWKCLNDPSANIEPDHNQLLGVVLACIPFLVYLELIASLVLMAISLPVRLNRLKNQFCLDYRCEKCGYRKHYKPD